MDKCTKERIKIASLRSLMTGGVGVALWFISGLVAHKYGWDLSLEAQAGISLLFAAGAWFGSKPMFSFTEECMLMQEAKSKRPKVADTKTVFVPQARVAGATPKIKADKPDKAKPATAAPQFTLATGKLVGQGKVQIEVSRPEGGATLVTVTTTGLSGSDFKGNNGNGGLRSNLEKISGIKWDNPKNVGGSRTMVGTVKSANEGEVATKLVEAASRYNR